MTLELEKIKVSDDDVKVKFKNDCKAGLVKLSEKLTERCPLNFLYIGHATYLDFQEMANHESSGKWIRLVHRKTDIIVKKVSYS